MIEYRRSYGANVRSKGDKLTISGLACPFYRRDVPGTQYVLSEPAKLGERIGRSAFDSTLREHDQRLLAGHDHAQLLGRRKADTLRLWTTRDGLHFEATLPDTTLARDSMAPIGDEILCGVSIGFTEVEDRLVNEAGWAIRQIEGLQLLEISLVTWPAYEATSVALGGSSKLRAVA